jgi:hypothetical protein
MANGAQGPKLPKIAGARPKLPAMPKLPAAPRMRMSGQPKMTANRVPRIPKGPGMP